MCLCSARIGVRPPFPGTPETCGYFEREVVIKGSRLHIEDEEWLTRWPGVGRVAAPRQLSVCRGRDGAHTWWLAGLKALD